MSKLESIRPVGDISEARGPVHEFLAKNRHTGNNHIVNTYASCWSSRNWSFQFG